MKKISKKLRNSTNGPSKNKTQIPNLKMRKTHILISIFSIREKEKLPFFLIYTLNQPNKANIHSIFSHKH